MASRGGNRSHRILIVSDDQFDVEEAIRLLGLPNLKIEQAMNSEWAIEQFDREPFDIILLSHSEVDVGYGFYMNFLMQSEKALDSAHQVILMCDGKEVSEAYRLCMEQYFDDYVVYKPLYDIYCLKFSVIKAIERLKMVNYEKHIEQRINSMISKMNEIKEVFKEVLSSNKDKKSKALDQEDELEVIIKSGFDKLKKHINESDISQLSKNNLHDNCEKIKKDILVDSLGEHSKEVDKLGESWMQEMLSSFQDEPEKKVEIKENIKILIVEDELVNQKVMNVIIKEQGYDTKIASDGEQAYLLCKKWKPDVVLMDIRMPKMNGLKVIKKLNNENAIGDMIIIMLTAHSEKVVVNECLKSGALDFIVKPAKKDILIERIHHFLSIKGLL